jgi:hypothetical protein
MTYLLVTGAIARQQERFPRKAALERGRLFDLLLPIRGDLGESGDLGGPFVPMGGPTGRRHCGLRQREPVWLILVRTGSKGP